MLDEQEACGVRACNLLFGEKYPATHLKAVPATSVGVILPPLRAIDQSTPADWVSDKLRKDRKSGSSGRKNLLYENVFARSLIFGRGGYQLMRAGIGTPVRFAR